MTTEAQRAAFEAFAKSKRYKLDKTVGGNYLIAQTAILWEGWKAAIRADHALPEPTVPDKMQDWAGMDGVTAFHLITRHSDNWGDVDKMMGEWLAANCAAAIREGV